MQFTSTILALLSLTTLSLSAPVAAPTEGEIEKRALTQQSYNQLSISAGVAGNAKAEALAKFPVNMANLAGVSAADLQVIQAERVSAENAETAAFNPAIAAASGAAKTALQNGKIKNKVLKLTAETLALQIQMAQGNKGAAAKLAVENKKLSKNIALDVAANGQKSTAVSFNG